MALAVDLVGTEEAGFEVREGVLVVAVVILLEVNAVATARRRR